MCDAPPDVASVFSGEFQRLTADSLTAQYKQVFMRETATGEEIRDILTSARTAAYSSALDSRNRASL